MTVTFDEMPGLEIDGGATLWNVTFQGVAIGVVSKKGIGYWDIFTVIPAPEQQKIATLINNYVTTQRAIARLRA